MKYRIWWPQEKRITYNEARVSLMPSFITSDFTGVQDGKGVDIYEGDVVQYKSSTIIGGNEIYVHTFRGIVEYSPKHAAFGLNMECHIEPFHEGVFDTNHTSDVEVVGNIYQNPELADTIS